MYGRTGSGDCKMCVEDEHFLKESDVRQEKVDTDRQTEQRGCLSTHHHWKLIYLEFNQKKYIYIYIYIYMIWYDMIWYDMIWYDMIWYDMIWYIFYIIYIYIYNI